MELGLSHGDAPVHLFVRAHSAKRAKPSTGAPARYPITASQPPTFQLRAVSAKMRGWTAIPEIKKPTLINEDFGMGDESFGGRFKKTHGLSGTRIARIWNGMLYRCCNPKSPSYKWYGGRGIIVCEEWRESLGNFIADMGHPPDGTTIDRINNNGNYEPMNCRWADALTQARNTSTVRLITVGEKTQSMSAWAEEYGITNGLLFSRLTVGMDIISALTKDAHAIRTHCRNGHEIAGKNLLVTSGARICRKCTAEYKNAWQRRDRAKKRQAAKKSPA